MTGPDGSASSSDRALGLADRFLLGLLGALTVVFERFSIDFVTSLGEGFGRLLWSRDVISCETNLKTNDFQASQ